MAQKMISSYFSAAKSKSHLSDKGDSSASQSLHNNGSGGPSKLVATISEEKVTEAEGETIIINEENLEEDEHTVEMHENSDSDEQGGEIVASNDSCVCECQCCTQPNVPNQPNDVSGSKVSLYYNTSGKKIKHNRKIQPTWYKKYSWIAVCSSRYKIFCVICRSIYQQGLLSTFSNHCKLTFCTTGFNAWWKALE